LSFDVEPSWTIISLRIMCMRMRAQWATSVSSGEATLRSSATMRSSFSSTALNDTSFSLFRMSRAERGMPGRSTGLMATRIVSSDTHSWTSGVMVGLPENPPSQ
jgi:hypothetical protein